MQLSSFPNGAGQELACVWPARSKEEPAHADVLQVVSERSVFCEDSTVLDTYIQGFSKAQERATLTSVLQGPILRLNSK